MNSLEQLVIDYTRGRPAVYCHSLTALEMRMRRPHHHIEIVLIYVSDPAEMVKLTKMRSLLMDSRLILVLPTHDVDMVAWAHKLGPRFIAYADIGLEQAGSVLEKMLSAKVYNFISLTGT
jgi:hypothetical protein